MKSCFPNRNRLNEFVPRNTLFGYGLDKCNQSELFQHHVSNASPPWIMRNVFLLQCGRPVGVCPFSELLSYATALLGQYSRVKRTLRFCGILETEHDERSCFCGIKREARMMCWNVAISLHHYIRTVENKSKTFKFGLNMSGQTYVSNKYHVICSREILRIWKKVIPNLLGEILPRVDTQLDEQFYINFAKNILDSINKLILGTDFQPGSYRYILDSVLNKCHCPQKPSNSS